MKFKTEDQVRDEARNLLKLEEDETAQAGVGQLTTFNQLGFSGIADKPDGWYLPENHSKPAMILEVKSTKIELGQVQVDELQKNIHIVSTQYAKVVGILYNGESVRVFQGEEEVPVPDTLQPLSRGRKASGLKSPPRASPRRQ